MKQTCKNCIMLLIILICLSVIVLANQDYERFQSKYNQEYEIATTGMSSFKIVNDTLIDLNVKTWSRIFKGNATYVEFKYKKTQNTVIHTHISDYCYPSNMDLDFLNNSKIMKLSIIICNKEILYMYKDNNEIKYFRVDK